MRVTLRSHICKTMFRQRIETSSRTPLISRSAQPSESHPPKTYQTAHPRTPTETVAWAPSLIYLDKYMLYGVYEESGICVRNHCGAEPSRDIEPPGLVSTVGWRDRASASYAAADRFEAPARAA